MNFKHGQIVYFKNSPYKQKFAVLHVNSQRKMYPLTIIINGVVWDFLPDGRRYAMDGMPSIVLAENVIIKEEGDLKQGEIYV